MHRITGLTPPTNQQATQAGNEASSPAARPLRQVRNILGNQAFGRALEADFRVSKPGEHQEQEANRTADRVMRKEAVSPTVTQQPVHQNSKTQNDFSSESQPLPPSVRGFFEPRLEHDLSHVRIHTGTTAAKAAHQTNARAFTSGSNVVFGAGEYQPESHEGRRLIAHELAHVVQEDRSGSSGRIWRQPADETKTTAGAEEKTPAKPSEPERPEAKFDFKLNDLLMYPLFVDMYKDLIQKKLTEKELKELGLKGHEAAAYYVWAAAFGLPFGGLGGEKYEGGLSKGLTTWSNYVDAITPLSLTDSAIMDGISRIVGLRVDEYLGSDLFIGRLKTHSASVVSLLALLQGGISAYYRLSGPGEAGELEPVDWAKHTTLWRGLPGLILKEKLTAPDFFDIKPLQMKSHPAFAATPFAGEAPAPGFTLEESEEVGGEGSKGKFALTANLAKFFTKEGGPTAAEMGDLQKYRGWQTSLWFNYDKINPTTAMAAVGQLPEEKLKGGVIFGGGGHLGMLEAGARYDGTAADELTSWFVKGGFGYSGTKGSILNRIGFTATYIDWTEKDILAPRDEAGTPTAGQAMQFTQFGKFEVGKEHKFGAGAALSFVTGSQESAGISSLRGDLSYTYMGDSKEERLPAFKVDLSGSLHRLDWFDPKSPVLWGLQAKGSAGRVFGGVEVMGGASSIPESRAAQIEKPTKVQVPLGVVFTAGVAY